MPDFLKGNYNINNNNNDTQHAKTAKSLTEQFEENALAKLGGSICFVSKSGSLIWDGDFTDSDTE
ncbi:MAG: hypothetical protein CL886_03695 [Dehalococcoidia bacterium]|nr:hypothetical protein [Dehalococcoidia bacterium]|tara:strand:+ start:789 stop:983 length:195 start_codon:yes stop_codon:yes gene_type:complete